MKERTIKDYTLDNRRHNFNNMNNITLLSIYDKMSEKEIFQNPEISSNRNIYLMSIIANSDDEESCKKVN